MVIVRLSGGLGNQLFQYAAGRAVAFRTKASIKLDTSQFKKYPNRNYYLMNFNISGTLISELRKYILAKQKGDNLLRRVASLSQYLVPENKGYQIFTERSFQYDPNILDVPGNVYLNGYWQSEKYFMDIDHIIRDEFQVSTTPDRENQLVADLITQHNSISLHIRRGDYLADNIQFQHHGVCSLEYYQTAIEFLLNNQKDPHFFIFSDDIPWAKENIKISYPVNFVDHNGLDKPHEDLRLMALCKHHIIANSTFSWWGAWLSLHRDKIIIGPKEWFNQANNDTSDLIPPSWIQL